MPVRAGRRAERGDARSDDVSHAVVGGERHLTENQARSCALRNPVHSSENLHEVFRRPGQLAHNAAAPSVVVLVVQGQPDAARA